MAQRFPNQRFNSRQGFPNRGMRGHVPNIRLPGPRPNRNMQGQNFSGNVQDRNNQSSVTDGRLQGFMYEGDIQGHNKGAQSYIPERNVQFPTHGRLTQGHEQNSSVTGPDRGISDGSLQRHMPTRVMQGQSHNRGMQGFTPDRNVNSPMPDIGIHDQSQDRGFQRPDPDRMSHNPLRNRDLQRHAIPDRSVKNSTLDKQMHGRIPGRGMPDHVPDRGIQFPDPNRVMHGHRLDRGAFPEESMLGPASDRGMQGHMPGRKMQGPLSDRGLHRPASDRGMQGTAPDRVLQGHFPERGIRVSDRGMQDHMTDITNKGPTPNIVLPGHFPERGVHDHIPDRPVQTSVPNKVIPRFRNDNQDTHQSSAYTSYARHQVDMVHGSNQYSQQQPFLSGQQGQQNISLGVQTKHVSHNSMQQGTIVQHVMIPVPVPLGTEISPDLLRPQVFTSASIPSQGNFVSPQGQTQYSEGQTQSNLTERQANSSFMTDRPSFQGQRQTFNMQHQGDLDSSQYQGTGPRFHPPKTERVASSDRDELSYYMDNQFSRRKSEESTHRYEDQRHMHDGDFYISRGDKDERYDQDYERKAPRVGYQQEHETDGRDLPRSHSSNDNSERYRRDEHSHLSLIYKEREQNDGFKRHEGSRGYEMHEHDTKSEHGHGEQFGNNNRDGFNRQTRFETSDRVIRHSRHSMEHDVFAHARYKVLNRDEESRLNEGPTTYSELNRREGFKRQEEFERHEKYEDVQFINNKEHETDRSDRSFPQNMIYERENVIDRANKFESFSSSDKRPSSSTDLRYEMKSKYKYEREFESNVDDIRKVCHSSINEFKGEERLKTERHSDAVLYKDGKREDVGKIERQSGAILYKDGNREDVGSRKTEHYDRKDKFYEPADENCHKSQEDYNRGNELGKRKLSPVSSERSSRKSKRGYSPVSDNKSHGDLKIHVSETGRWIETESNASPIINDAFESEKHDKEINWPNEKDELNSLDGAEMISDSESCIGGDENDIRTQLTDLSPVSQHSTGVETERIEDNASEHKLKGTFGEDSKSDTKLSKASDEKQSLNECLDEETKTDDEPKKEKQLDLGSKESQSRKKHSSGKKFKEYQLKVPDLCQAHIQKGCGWNGCSCLHICRFFILDMCKFGNTCTKGHNFFVGQPFKMLCQMNPGFAGSSVTVEQIKLTLKNRISALHVPANLQKRLTTYKTSYTESASVTTEEQSVEIDPTFDARNYAPGSNFNFSAAEKEGKIKTKKPVKKTDTSKENKSANDKVKSDTVKGKTVDDKNAHSKVNKSKETKRKLTNDEKGKNKRSRQEDGKKTMKEIGKIKTGQSSKAKESKDENALSPISGDEDDWEKYEKYEKVSEDELSEKDIEADLDNVSSDESIVELVQVNRSVDAFPLPTPENIAVPIGMNDPLVFNRPLKNNPQSYIAPLNRPPPMFPITSDNNRPLFPVVDQNVQPINVGGAMSGMTLGVHGPLPGAHPNHLPSPEFMQHVIQNLPKFNVGPSEEKNVFKNDNNPTVVESESPKKIKSDKGERDPDLKETIKRLWKFPHKGVFNMSVIEFVTETEAYKEEFIAEIIRILVTLELPYVTMKKLVSVIKEKVSINVKSETDLRKILEMYPNHFKIIEIVDSDDESDEPESKKNVKIKANIGLGFCEKHGFLPFAIGKCECNALHLCKFYFLSDCPNKLCKFGHKLKSEHNVAVLRQHRLHRLTGGEIMNYLSDVDNRNKETIPNICKYYIREKGCYKGDNTDYDTICHSLHLCSYILKGRCMNRECDRSHCIRDKQPLSLLQKFGLDPNELGDETVLQMLGERAIESEKDKVKRLGSNKENSQGKGSIGVLSGNSVLKQKSSPGEGLSILTVSERRISSKYYVQNFRIPAVCKFYQNEMGCRKKDWGAEGKCFFLHICQHYVSGDCKFGSKCKRSHDLFSGQAAEILEKYNFDLRNMSSGDILKRLNSNSGAPVELPKGGIAGYDNEKVEVTVECRGESSKFDMAKYEKPEWAGDVKAGLINKDTMSDTFKGNSGTNKPKSATQTRLSYGNRDIEDVIKHIMEHNKVDKK